MLPASVVTTTATINPRIISSRTIGTLLLTGAFMTALTGCGQKGDLYLVDTNSQMVTNSSEALDSTSNPQDAAFAGLNDAEYEQAPDGNYVSDDPNDY
ncbi:lipoprotein [Psychrobacter sp. 16-MNA-CIBAN-0192]|uniref:LPS translocon maturation chaperone LptM n=1 Tax=Psychrobacter sp. 16-MNA-CIBAN-0192 TaxID=3140448 RepID=UPI0033196CA8